MTTFCTQKLSDSTYSRDRVLILQTTPLILIPSASWQSNSLNYTKRIFLLVPPEIIIQSSFSRLSSQLLLNCTITARPLTSTKWKRNRIELTNIKRIEINDYTIQLILSLQVNWNFQNPKTNTTNKYFSFKDGSN
jgi:hypothetical protein